MTDLSKLIRRVEAARADPGLKVLINRLSLMSASTKADALKDRKRSARSNCAEPTFYTCRAEMHEEDAAALDQAAALLLAMLKALEAQ